MTELEDWQRQSKNQWHSVTDNTILRPQEWQRKMCQKKDWQNKSQWQRVIDNTQNWDHKSDREWVEQEPMTESDWQHKVETTRVTEN